MSSVDLIGVHKSYGPVNALRPVDLTIEEGEFLTLLGPSGCGKTTTLRIVAGFVEPTGGRVMLGGADITWAAPNRRNIGMVFQDYALFPHMTVAENIGFGLQERGEEKRRIERRVRELLELIHLPDAAGRYPSEISGGQAQRVAVARAVAYAPGVLLMDEPLGALDLKLREAMQKEIRRIQQELRITTIYVTHDQVEAMAMSDRIAVMKDGVMQQVGTAREIYDRPSTRFVADFVGQINLVDGVVRGREGPCWVVDVAGRTFRGQSDENLSEGQEVTLAVRPEAVALGPADAPPNGHNALEGHVMEIGFAGNIARVTLALDSGRQIVSEMRPQELDLSQGQSVRASWAADRTRFLTA
mgnify:CR=1 FL=1|jgi:spermidine/putrescine ABC transporter ATP-binding subunit